MSDELPAYLRDNAFADLPAFDDADKPGAKNVKRESADTQLARVLLPMPSSQYNAPGDYPEPEWLLKGEPRPAQIEALRRSYYGHWQREGEFDTNSVGYRLRDNQGFGRTGPARGWGHFMEQRLGKTPVLLNEFALFRRDYDFKWQIVVAPNQFKPEWADEADRFGLDCPSYVFNSNNREDAQRWVHRNSRGGGIIAINYESLLSDATLAFLEELSGDHSAIGFDESVSIKNMDGVLSKNSVLIARKFKVKRVLTGKPVVQGAHDLYMQFRAIEEQDGVNPFAFRNRFCKMGGFQGKKPIGVKEDRIEELHSLIVGCAFPARRVNWMKTPKPDYARRHIQMLPEQRVHYKRMEENFLTEITRMIVDNDGVVTEDLLTIAADQITTKLLKLQQIASGFIIDENGVPHDIMPPKINPKLVETKRMLTEELDNKAIIFVHHRHSIDLLREALAEFKPAFIVGDQQAKLFGVDTQAEKRRFNGDPACRVVIGQALAIRYGHTLMGSPEDPCLTEVYYENTYDLNTRSQCEERPQGKGQAGAISIYDFISAPVEAGVIDALVAKEDISAAVMNYARDTGVLARGPTDGR